MKTSDTLRLRRVPFVDSHTAGEPTRVIVAGGPDLGSGPLAERVERFRRHHDDFRRAVICEPRGSDVAVGALLCEATAPDCSTGVIFFNNQGYLGMCGHGAIGVVATLAYLGRARPGALRIETPVGVVTAALDDGGEVTVENVPSYRAARRVAVDVDGIGRVHGDVAWGGNWFFLVEERLEDIAPARIARLTAIALAIRAALERGGVRGDDGGAIDHVELFGPPTAPGARGKCFVLCPGGAYDRSPCGTGTSAKLACLIEDGVVAPGETWVQESVIGSTFRATGRIVGGRVVAAITGAAHVTSAGDLILDAADPFRAGIPTWG